MWKHVIAAATATLISANLHSIVSHFCWFFVCTTIEIGDCGTMRNRQLSHFIQVLNGYIKKKLTFMCNVPICPMQMRSAGRTRTDGEKKAFINRPIETFFAAMNQWVGYEWIGVSDNTHAKTMAQPSALLILFLNSFNHSHMGCAWKKVFYLKTSINHYEYDELWYFQRNQTDSVSTAKSVPLFFSRF